MLDTVEFTWALPADGGSAITSAEVSSCHWYTGTRTLDLAVWGSTHKVPATSSAFSADAFTWRYSMADFVSTLGFYWSDTPAVSVKFNNYLGGVWPDRAVQDDYVSADCRTNLAAYSDANDWGTDLHLMTTPGRVESLAEDPARTNAAQITATWTYPVDGDWELADWYRASSAPTHSDGADPLAHYVIKYYAQSRADLDKVDGTVVDAAFAPGGTLEVTLTSTAKGSTYAIGVTAVNSMGSSAEATVTIQQAETPSVITNGETS